ncbi:MAG: SDR family NAD(P)-dependent oxidoreductase [Cellvibrionales bacterium]|nr:SDR family NAD(P)-dependent oxidoreductase [Cellvibrionales bacterium]
MSDFSPSIKSAMVFGASGAIGRAFVDTLASKPQLQHLYAISRKAESYRSPTITPLTLNTFDDDSLKALAATINQPIDLIIIATGVLHTEAYQPEKSLKQLTEANAINMFQTNTLIPALIIKHFSPKLRKKSPSILATLSARVGSISDNHLGGWYSYRTSKAALNMMIKCAAIEIARKEPQHILVGIHPGTVDSNLSKPFQAHVKEGQLQSPEASVKQLIATLCKLSSSDSGHCFAYDGSEIFP